MKESLKIMLLVLAMQVSISCTLAEKNLIEGKNISLMFEAVSSNNVRLLSKSITSGENVNAISDSGESPLMVAILKENFNVFKYLLEQGANPNFRVINGDPSKRLVVMEQAAINDNSEYLTLLLKYGGNPNALGSYQSRTILFEAIMGSELTNVEILVKAGASIKVINANKEIPLHTAIYVNNFDIAYYLIKEGASFTVKNKWGYSAIDLINDYGSAGVKKGSQQEYWYKEVIQKINEIHPGLLK